MASVQNIPGMRDFFGRKLGGMVYGAFSHLSPIDLAAKETAGKIATAATGGGIMGAGAEILGIVRSGIKNRGSYKIGDWFRGFNIGESAEGLSSSIRNKRLAMRVGVPAGIGLTGLTGAISPGNPIETTGKAGLQLGTLATTSAVLGSQHWGLGAAYAAWGGLNMMRRGDNMGPF